MNELSHMVVEKLLQLRSFQIQINNPLTWGNGWKSPVYLDDRKILSYTKARNFVKLELGRLVAELYPDADVIAGIAVNAVAHGVLVAEQLALPFVYVHPTPKNHGLENQIEGDLRPRQKVVIIENQVNVGKNALSVIDAIRSAGCTVLGVVTIFDYQLRSAHEKFNEAGVPLVSLAQYDELERQLPQHRYDEETMACLKEWHADPAAWAKKHK
ncbi:MAG: orotate phosphoribosyltransferase [Paludibacteraceae bacterium]|jgi:orotate phosphoribosyltransferase|nr:orotate phosphoribosyltransferase [Paludibacteraceae bacterium]